LAIPGDFDVRIVEGSSERMLLPDCSVDLVLTDPPYHDDVQYDELSLPLRAWAALSVEHLEASATVNLALMHNSGGDEYEALLTRIFIEARRTLRDDGHLILSYANRVPEAWVALLSALDRAGFRACGYLVVHSENESDVAKRGVRACTLDLIMDLIPKAERLLVKQLKPPSLPITDEGTFLGIVGEHFLQVGNFSEKWADDLTEQLSNTVFHKGTKKADVDTSSEGSMRPVTGS
jgi:putative DNA methylase